MTVEARARSFARGSRPPIVEGYFKNGLWHVTDGNHTREALVKNHGEDSDIPIRIDAFEPKSDRQARIRAAQRNAHRNMTMPEWQGAVADARADGCKTQQEIGDLYGVTQQHISAVEIYNPLTKAGKALDKEYKPFVEPYDNSMSDLNSPVAPSPSDGQPVPSVSPPPQLGGATSPPPISLTSEIPPETGEIGPSASLHPDSKPALGVSNGGTLGPSKSASHPSSPVPVGPSPPSFLSPAPPSPLRHLREALEGLQAALKMPEWEDALEDASTARAARGLLASHDASLYDFRAFLEDGRRTKDGPLPRAQVFTLKIMDEVRIRTEENGHRAWVMAHLPGGKANLRVLRGKEKTMEIHLERDLIPVLGAKA